MTTTGSIVKPAFETEGAVMALAMVVVAMTFTNEAVEMAKATV